MSEWPETRASFKRLVTNLAHLTFERRFIVFIGYLGLALMAIAIVMAFGWVGVVFLIGRVFYTTLVADRMDSEMGWD